MSSEDWKYQRRRSKLVETLRQKGISDSHVLHAVGNVPRHLFVDPALRARSYDDEALPIGYGQTISQPYTVAYQTEMLEVRPGNRILEVGTGSGYQAAILCEMRATVYSVERIRALYDRTRDLMGDLGYRLTMKCDDGTVGWAAFAPYDGIVVTAGATNVPDALITQLRLPDVEHRGGRLVIPVGGPFGQTMHRFTRTGPDSTDEEQFHDFRFVPLIDDS